MELISVCIILICLDLWTIEWKLEKLLKKLDEKNDKHPTA